MAQDGCGYLSGLIEGGFESAAVRDHMVDNAQTSGSVRIDAATQVEGYCRWHPRLRAKRSAPLSLRLMPLRHGRDRPSRTEHLTGRRSCRCCCRARLRFSAIEQPRAVTMPVCPTLIPSTPDSLNSLPAGAEVRIQLQSWFQPSRLGSRRGKAIASLFWNPFSN